MSSPQSIQRIYLTLLTGNTLAASFIWGINTIFLLNAGLSNFEAFAANAFFTAGMVLFEVPTGVIADTMGRRMSYLLGTITLLITTLLYWYMWKIDASFVAWASVSLFLGLGFTFFSGAVEAWLVDALEATGFTGELESVFAKGQIVMGGAMLIGSVSGGFIAQITDLGIPYIIRSVILGITCILAYFFMKDIGFTPAHGKHPFKEMKKTLSLSLQFGLKNQKIKWVMYAAPFAGGVSFYIFYALQPYLLSLYGDDTAYGIAGIAAALVAGAQMLGGFASPFIRKVFPTRTAALLFGGIVSTILLALLGIVPHFFVVLLIVALWGLLFSAVTPIRQAFLNQHIPSTQRATVLSFDALLSSSGGILTQPVLGKAADIYGYPASYLISSVFQLVAIPFLLKAYKEEN